MLIEDMSVPAGQPAASTADARIRSAEEAFARAARGDGSGIGPALAALEGNGAASTAWRLALRALAASLDPAAMAPTEAELAAASAGIGPSDAVEAALARAGLVRACLRLELRAALSFDAASAARVAALRAELGSLPHDQAFIPCLAALISGDPPPPEPAPSAPHAAKVAWQALTSIWLPTPDPDARALERARAASRSVGAAGDVELEYVAHLALARLRRLSGRPHLALHILGALGRSAPATWHGWIAWEMLLAGGAPQASALLDALAPSASRAQHGAPIVTLARAGLALLGAAEAGDRAALGAAARALTAGQPRWTAAMAEIAACAAMLDPEAPSAEPGVEAWRAGQRAAAPFGLHGLGVPPSAPIESERGYAYVAAQPGRPARRLLRAGLGLVTSARNLEGPDEAGKGGFRTETGLAVIALAGPAGLSREDFVRGVYGFKYVPLRHQGVLDVLVHRMRARLTDEATLERSTEAGLRLVVTRPFVVPDGRCTVPVGERVLRALATLGWTGVQSASEALQIPRRTTQRALQELVADGACKVSRSGGKLLYRVHDTTFTVMTMPGVAGARAP
jgi:hypothetical protein